MFPGHRVPESSLSHVPRPQGTTIKPQSCSQATGFFHHTSVMFPGHRIPQSNISHVPRPMVYRIKPQSCSQGTGFQNHTNVKFPGHGFPSRPQSCFQGIGFHNQTSVMLPVHRFLPSNLSQVPRPQGSGIKPQSFGQARVFHHKPHS